MGSGKYQRSYKNGFSLLNKVFCSVGTGDEKNVEENFRAVGTIECDD